MRVITKDELTVILANHKKWLRSEQGGVRADLSEADLTGANLTGADLWEANLTGANLTWANLTGANLTEASLWEANLTGADLWGAKNFHTAKQYNTNLVGSRTDKKYYQIQCIGSRNGNTTYCPQDDIVWCGCFVGTMAEFEKRVNETHKGNKQYLKEYKSAIKFFKSLTGK